MKRAKLCGNRHGTRWRGKLVIPESCHPLVRKLLEIMNRDMTCMREVERRAGLRPGTIGGWRRRSSPQLVNIEACFNVLGYGLTVKEKRE